MKTTHNCHFYLLIYKQL